MAVLSEREREAAILERHADALARRIIHAQEQARFFTLAWHKDEDLLARIDRRLKELREPVAS